MTRDRVALIVPTLVVAALLLPGCLEKPRIEDRWTRVDVLGSNITPDQSITLGTMVPVNVHATVTYRAIVTGYAVAELRESGTLATTDVALNPEAPRVPMALDIDRLLANSVSVGRAVRAVTGWDHLIQTIDFNFNAWAPAAGDSGRATRGLFLVCYLGSGVKIETPGQPDSIAVTPFLSTPHQILPVGMELSVAP